MEFLSYALEGTKLPFSDHTDFRSENPLNHSMRFVKPVLPEMTRKPFLSNQCLESSCSDTNNNSVKSSKVSLNSDSVMELGTRFSSSADVEKLAAPSEPNGKRFSIDNLVLSSSEPSLSAKRARITNLHSSVPNCQVYGCNKDLSLSKDYYKRHKVCDVHSKTAVVIVNGIKQRFCQQCSRFHVLAEFDEGKRSCRKRLAGHNQRRRKPEFDTFMGSSYLSTDASKTSLLLPDDLRCNNPINHSRHLKLEQHPSQISQYAANMKFEQSLPNSFMHSYFMKKQSPHKHGLNTPLSVPESYVFSNSSCALSLLSAQSHNNLLSNSLGMPTPHPLISKENYHSDLCTLQNSAKPNWRQNTSESFTPMIFNPSGIDQEGLPLVPDEISRNEISQNFNALNRTSYLSPVGSETVNLLELSLHLQRVEEQKYSDQVKMENRVFCNSTYTS